MSAPDWKDVLPTPPSGASLQEAWFTTYDVPDAGLLVEHLLPSLLGTSYSLSKESQERTMFFGELSTTLEAFRGRIIIISSPSKDERRSLQYPWLWRYVNHFTVGSVSRAVQHAKLWAFHWKIGGKEHIELYVSSTNLTPSAFKGQVQAGWQGRFPLGERGSQNKRRTWGELIPFLEALGSSAGDIAMRRIQRLVELLNRVECPANVTFVASIPGDKSAARQLKQFEVSEVHVMTPTIGEWNGESLLGWGTDAGVSTNKVHLKWIAQDHPWAKSGCWTISKAAYQAMTIMGVKLDCLPNDVQFTDEHRDGDIRWSHAKLYLIRSKKKRRLLITSANWSTSAWGAGAQAPRNFELGVVTDTDWTDLETMGKPFGQGSIPFYIEGERRGPDDLVLQWAGAVWDGACIQLRARSSDISTPITVAVFFTDAPPEGEISLTDGSNTTSWKDSQRPPITARFVQGKETLEVNVVDIRTSVEFAKTPLPEIDPAVAAELREVFLLQRYGGPMVDPDSIHGKGVKASRKGASAPGADYSVQAWLDARAAFGVVDKWRAARDEAKTDADLLEKIRLDGDELWALYAKRGEIALDLVAEELSWHLSEKHDG